MKITRLRKTPDHKIEEWLATKLQLTPYQKECMLKHGYVRSAPFYFYEAPPKVKTVLWWRITIIPFLIYIVLLICFGPVKWIFTGKWGYGQSFIDKYYSPWEQKLGL